MPLESEAAELAAELAQQMRTQRVATLYGPLATCLLTFAYFLVWLRDRRLGISVDEERVQLVNL